MIDPAKYFEDFIKSAFLGQSISWPTSFEVEKDSHFLEFTHQNGIQPLVYYCLRKSGSFEKCPPTIRASLEDEAKRQVAIDVIRLRNLHEVLQTLSEKNIIALLLKGTPLSCLYYADSSSRPRCDTDLLIKKEDLKILDTILLKLGYSRINSVSGDFVRHQFIYSKPGPEGIGSDLDVHWKISNPILFADMFSFDELLSTCIEIPVLGQHARTLSSVNALLLACIHRVAHHNHCEKLIWLYDIHLLANQLNQNDFIEFWEKAKQKKIKSICWNGLNAARSWFNTKFSEPEKELSYEPSAQYLRSNLRSIDLFSMDLKHLSVRCKIQLLKENLFPPASYMLQRYNVAKRFLLPGLYLHRGVTGAWKWLQQPRQK